MPYPSLSRAKCICFSSALNLGLIVCFFLLLTEVFCHYIHPKNKDSIMECNIKQKIRPFCLQVLHISVMLIRTFLSKSGSGFVQQVR